METKDPHHLLAWLRLTHLRGIGPILIKRLLDKLGTPQAILNAHPANLAAIDGIGTIKASQIVASIPESLDAAERELACTRQHGWHVVPMDDPAYPPGLKVIHDPPTVLFVRGEIQPNDAVAVGMVGARRCTLYGREQAQKLAMHLAERGLAVISGGARGIDTCSHLGALQAGGRTVVVAGCGLLHTYPPENQALYDRIVSEGRGAIITELPPDAPPTAENFPPRNRIIAGMSLGIIVVEANLGSGSLITARLAAADYGREVFALPGRVDSPASSGTHHLIKTAAAHLVESAQDVLDHLGDVGALLTKISQEKQTFASQAHGLQAMGATNLSQAEQDFDLEGNRKQRQLFAESPAPPPKPIELTSVQKQILSAIGAKGGANLDDIVDATGLMPQIIMADLTLLEIKAQIKRASGNLFHKNA